MSADPFDLPEMDDIPDFAGRWPDDPPPDPDHSTSSRSRGKFDLRWHGEADPNADRAWLIRNLVFEVGKGLFAGQWGSGKTFGVLDMSASVMTGEPFAGRTIARTGGVLFIAPEGAFEIPIRLRGLIDGKLRGNAIARAFEGAQAVDLDNLPFAWIEECPRLVEKDATAVLVALGQDAATQMRERFDVPLVLVIIDTVAAGAGFDDENSAAESQKVMNAMEALGRATGAFVLGVDHFGKAVETGTRGSSAKEAAADVVLAMLATRDEAGGISNTRMAVRKVRGARCGYEIPYALEVVELGRDRDDEPITTCIVSWQEARGATVAAAVKDRWTASLKVLRQAVTTALDEHGIRAWPFGSTGPEHKAAPWERVRASFYAIYPAEGGDEKKRADAKRQAFGRAVNQALGKDVLGSIELNGVDHLWIKADGT